MIDLIEMNKKSIRGRNKNNNKEPDKRLERYEIVRSDSVAFKENKEFTKPVADTR